MDFFPLDCKSGWVSGWNNAFQQVLTKVGNCWGCSPSLCCPCLFSLSPQPGMIWAGTGMIPCAPRWYQTSATHRDVSSIWQESISQHTHRHQPECCLTFACSLGAIKCTSEKIRIMMSMKGCGGNLFPSLERGIQRCFIFIFCHKSGLLTAGMARELHSHFYCMVKG